MRHDRAWMGSLLLLATGAAQAAERPWVEVKTPHFTLVSNDGEKSARELGWQFEQVRAAIKIIWPWARKEDGRPFVVFVLRDTRGLREIAPEYWTRVSWQPHAVFASALDADWVAMRTDAQWPDHLNVNPWKTAFEGYADNVLSRTFPGPLPPWFREGMTEVFGNTLVRDKDIQFGRLIPWHLDELRKGTRMSLSRVLAVTRQDPEYTKESERRQFAAQSWAFVHYLAFGDKGAQRDRLNRFATLLRAGQAADEATREGLGDLAALEKGYQQYHSRQLYQFLQYNVDVQVTREGFTVRSLPAAEVHAIHARFNVALGQPARARTLLETARAADPGLHAVYEVEGQILDRENKADEARAAYARAADLGSTNAYVHQRLGQLLWNAPGDKDWARIAAAYGRAAALAPADPELLRWQAEALIRAGKYAEAEVIARRGVAVDDAAAGPRVALGLALTDAQRYDEAAAALQAAASRVRTPQEREAVRHALDWLNRARGAGAEADVHTRCIAGDPAACATWRDTLEPVCEGGQAAACTGLAWLLERGTGVAKDTTRAEALYGKACAAKHARGCVGLAVLLLGRSNVDDQKRGRSILDETCKRGDAQACSMASQLAASGSR